MGIALMRHVKDAGGCDDADDVSEMSTSHPQARPAFNIHINPPQTAQRRFELDIYQSWVLVVDEYGIHVPNQMVTDFLQSMWRCSRI